MYPPIQQQTRYGHGGWNILKGMSNYIFYQEVDVSEGDLGYLVQGFGSFPTEISKFLGGGHPQMHPQTSYGARGWGI
jgi:hypothetical protein